MIMLRILEILSRIRNRTTGSNRNARIAAIATGMSTGCRKEIAWTTMLPTRKTIYPIT